MSEFDDVVDTEDGSLGKEPLERQLTPGTRAWLASKHGELFGMSKFLAESDRLSAEHNYDIIPPITKDSSDQ